MLGFASEGLFPGSIPKVNPPACFAPREAASITPDNPPQTRIAPFSAINFPTLNAVSRAEASGLLPPMTPTRVLFRISIIGLLHQGILSLSLATTFYHTPGIISNRLLLLNPWQQDFRNGESVSENNRTGMAEASRLRLGVSKARSIFPSEKNWLASSLHSPLSSIEEPCPLSLSDGLLQHLTFAESRGEAGRELRHSGSVFVKNGGQARGPPARPERKIEEATPKDFSRARTGVRRRGAPFFSN